MTLTHSEQINELAAALAKAQGAMRGALKDSQNPHFKSRYADLESVWEACRGPLTAHGLSVVQSPHADGATVHLDTILLHTSGQWMRGTATATARDGGPQAVGSTITYLRRYALQSFAGVAPADDDAEAAEGRAPGKSAWVAAPDGYDRFLEALEDSAAEGVAKLTETFKAAAPAHRAFATQHDRERMDRIKAKAQQGAAA